MLVNNFKALLNFGGKGTFKDVQGNIVNVSDFIQGLDITSANSHSINGVVRSFDYFSRPGSNIEIFEQNQNRGFTDLINIEGANGFVICFGSGNQVVTSEDYCLQSPCNQSGIGFQYGSVTHSSDGKIIIDTTFRNSSSSSVTINEIGIYIFKADSMDNTYPLVMIGRKVLNNPIEFSNGGNYMTFHYVIDISNNVFSETPIVT